MIGTHYTVHMLCYQCFVFTYIYKIKIKLSELHVQINIVYPFSLFLPLVAIFHMKSGADVQCQCHK